MTYPWHARLMARVQAVLDSDRVPNALLLSQPPGWGIAELAAQLVSRLIPGLPGDLDALQRVAHPDFLLVRRDGHSQIVVDQVRTANDFVMGTAQHGRKVVLMPGAEYMNPSAANALLKSLEEPPMGNVLMLVAERPQRLLPTIRSRCQIFTERTPGIAESLGWLIEAGVDEHDARPALALCGGAPLLALAAASDSDGRTPAWFLDQQRRLLQAPGSPLAVARELAGADPETVLTWWVRLAHHAMRVGAGAAPCLDGVDARLARVPAEELAGFADCVNEARAGLRVNLNPTLLFDHLAWRFTQLASSID